MLKPCNKVKMKQMKLKNKIIGNRLKTIDRKPRKAPYRKSDAVKELERLAMDEARRKYPNHPEGVLAPRIFRDDTANHLTTCITTYLKLKGAFCSRLNNTGIFDKRLNRYRPGTSRKGLPDVLATYQGKSIFIEVKAGRDRMSTEQEKIQKEQNGSGGLYFIAHNFTDFKLWFDSI
jgi:hypothetical protein